MIKEQKREGNNNIVKKRKWQKKKKKNTKKGNPSRYWKESSCFESHPNLLPVHVRIQPAVPETEKKKKAVMLKNQLNHEERADDAEKYGVSDNNETRL